MADKVRCPTHGECKETLVCTHLLGDSAVLGFNREEPGPDDPFPGAWCDDCELIRAAHNGWNEESSKLIKLSPLCSGGYERVHIRNTRTAFTLSDLADLRWKCGSCEQWHKGPCLDFGHDSPTYWREEHQKASAVAGLLPSWSEQRRKTFLEEDFCAIDNHDFFVRGNIHLPITGAAETFRWGVWGSLSRNNFETLLKMNDDPTRAELPPMFSWSSNRIPEYPDTSNLKTYVHVQKPGQRSHFEVELTDHPLSQEFHKGIAPERVREIMMSRLRDANHA